MRRSVMVTLLAFALLSCGDGEGAPHSYIRASIDGIVWSATATEGQVIYTVEEPAGPGIIVSIASRRQGAGSQTLVLGLDNPPALGTIALDGVAGRASYLSCPNDILADCAPWYAIPSDPGSVTITRIEPASGLIEGTFAFTGHLLADSTGPTEAFTAGRFVIFAPGVFILE